MNTLHQWARRGPQLRTLFLVALGLFLGLIPAGYILDWQWTGFPNKNLFDWLRILFFPAAVAIGTFVLNQAAKEREQARVRSDAENEVRKDRLFTLMRIYNDTKKVRRFLKAHIVTKRDGSIENEISCNVYEKQVEKLTDLQVELEVYKPVEKEATSALLLPFENAERITGHFGKAERYLNNVIHEYDGGHYQGQKQELFPAGIDSSSRIPLDNLPELKKFIGTGTFLQDYVFTIKEINKEMQKEIGGFYALSAIRASENTSSTHSLPRTRVNKAGALSNPGPNDDAKVTSRPRVLAWRG
jgi:hypothetical protein